MRDGRGRRRRAGFTLIEILAVVTILALMMALVIPNLSGLRERALAGQAQRLSDQLALARQRAIVTGVPHRMWMNLDEAEFRIEWLQTSDLSEPAPESDPIELAGNTPLSLEAPRREQHYEPVPGNFGNLQVLEHPFYIEAVETPSGRFAEGEVFIGFARDGTADYTEIYLEDPSGIQIALDVYPLDERVRIRRDL